MALINLFNSSSSFLVISLGSTCMIMLPVKKDCYFSFPKKTNKQKKTHNEIPPHTVRMTIINKSTNKCWGGYREKQTLVHCWWECRLEKLLWKTVWSYLKKLKMELSYDPVIPFLGIYVKNPEILIERIWATLCS